MEHVDDLTVQYEDEGEVVIEELAKSVLSKGAWATGPVQIPPMGQPKKRDERHQVHHSSLPKAEWPVPPASQIQHLVDQTSQGARRVIERMDH